MTKFAYGKVTSDGTSRVTTTDAGGNKSDVVTDARGLETSITDYAGGTTAGIQRTYEYDWEGNVTAVDYAGTGSELTGLTFEYDSSRKLTKIKAKTGGLLSDTVREYSYYDQNRVSTIRDHYAFTGSGSYLEKSYTYDDFGRVTSMAYRGGSYPAENDMISSGRATAEINISFLKMKVHRI